MEKKKGKKDVNILMTPFCAVDHWISVMRFPSSFVHCP